MKRKMILAAAAYMSGLFFASFFTGISGAIALGAAVCGVFAVGRLRGMTKRDVLIAVCCFAAAVGYIRIYTAVSYDKVTAYGGTEGSFSGRVAGIKSYPGEKALYTLKGRVNGSRTAKITVYTDDTGVRYGDIIDIGSCGFSVPEDDYLYKTRGKLRSEGVYVTASGAKDVTVRSKHRSLIKNRLMSYRERMVDEFRSELGDEKGTFLAGMIFGRSVSVDDDVRTSLSRCGIAHILAVSGLHVSIAAFAFMWLMKRLRVRRGVAFALMNLFIALLVIMAESSLSAVRAAIMLDFHVRSRTFPQAERLLYVPCGSCAAHLHSESLCGVQRRLSAFRSRYLRYRRCSSVHDKEHLRRQHSRSSVKERAVHALCGTMYHAVQHDVFRRDLSCISAD